jgi:serine/threonine-protein kinase
MSHASIADLLDALRVGKLLEPAQLEQLPQLQRQFDNPQALARELIRRDWLTPFQVNQLLKGRGDTLVLGSYVLMQKLGEGGMGAVYKARNWKLGRIVALKVIRKERLNNETITRRFRREIEAAAQLSHPNIAHAYDADEVAGTHFFVMEFVEGRDLAQVVKEGGPLPVAEACDYIRQAALGLQHAHERGLVHRDIKPSNLLLAVSRPPNVAEVSATSATRNGRETTSIIKLLDMGLARLERTASEHSTTLTQEGAVMGTPDYIAPEQARDSHSADIRADLYSLGCTLYFLLTGKPPFPGGSLSEKLLKHQLQEPRPVEQLRAEVPPALAQLVRKLMAKRPEQRFQTPSELAVALEQLVASGGGMPADSTLHQRAAATRLPDDPFADIDLPSASSASTQRLADARTPPELVRAPRRRWPFVVAGVAGAALVSAVVLVLLLSRDRPKPKEDDHQTAPKQRDGVERTPSVGADAHFFNGKDLTGWEGLPKYWFVREDGALVGTNGDKPVPFSTFLCSKKKYTDFELKFQVRLTEGAGNSGVQIRSELFDRKQFAVKGPQCDIGPGFWGDLYGENAGGMMKEAPKDTVKRALKPKEFNDYYIKCVGQHVTIKLNGLTTVDDDFPGMPKEGIIALQLHGGFVMETTFKGIQFRDFRLAGAGPKPLTTDQAKKQQQDAAEQLGVPVRLTNSIGMKLNLIPAGQFLMGSPESEPGRRTNEGPVHPVTITMPFYMGVYEVKQEQFQRVIGKNPSFFNKDNRGGPDYPVESVTWDEAVEFCKKLSALAREKSARRGYRLPTEAEWEYACRARTSTAYSFGDDAGKLDQYGWWVGNDGGSTHPVGKLKPNAWGLYDMHGNNWELCADFHAADYYAQSPRLDPKGPSTGTFRVLRSGAIQNPASEARSANRWPDWPPNSRLSRVGFRVVCEVGPLAEKEK